MTDNVLTAFATGPAGTVHPSAPVAPPSPDGLLQSAASAADVAQRAY